MSVDDQVRARLQSRLASAGVREREVALEIVWWLPAEFVEAYERLFTQALQLGDSSSMGRAAGDEGRVKKGASKAGGRRVYKGEWIVRDERAMEVKDRVDRRLKNIVRGVWNQYLREEGRVVEESQGSTPGVGVRLKDGRALAERKVGERVQKFCRECGRIAKGDWVRCPYPHA